MSDASGSERLFAQHRDKLIDDLSSERPLYRTHTEYTLSNMCAQYTDSVPECKSMSHQSTPIIVFGASGRMGARVCALASNDQSTHVIAAIVRADSPRIGQIARDVASGEIRFISRKNAEEMPLSQGEVLIDFSGDDGSRQSIELALARRAGAVICTTALSSETMTLADEAAKKIPLLISPNTSMGVAVLASAVAMVAKLLGTTYECSIVEAHHSKKKDAPSGTALRLARAVKEAGAEIKDDQVVAIRGGDVIGEHTVRFAGPGEYVELTHRATSRDLFALGAIRAARWLSGRRPGRYSIEDVLGIATRSTQNRG